MPHDPITFNLSHAEAEVLDLMLCKKTGANQRFTVERIKENKEVLIKAFCEIAKANELRKNGEKSEFYTHLQTKLRHAIDT